MNPQQELSLAKHQLYRLLLEKPSKYWTETELEIAFQLSKDVDIQKTLTEVTECLNKKEKR